MRVSVDARDDEPPDNTGPGKRPTLADCGTRSRAMGSPVGLAFGINRPRKPEIPMTREAVFVSYARTGLAKSARGGFNITPTMSLAAHAIKHAVARSGVEAEAVEDVYLGN